MQSIKGKSKHLATPWLPAVFLVRQVVCLFQPLLARRSHSDVREVFLKYLIDLVIHWGGGLWWSSSGSKSVDRDSVIFSPTDMIDCGAFNGLVPRVSLVSLSKAIRVTRIWIKVVKDSLSDPGSLIQLAFSKRCQWLNRLPDFGFYSTFQSWTYSSTFKLCNFQDKIRPRWVKIDWNMIIAH